MNDSTNIKCLSYVNKLINNELAKEFVNPIYLPPDEMALYKEKCPQPMCLKDVQNNLKNKHYNHVKRWENDLKLIFQNAISYNSKNSIIGVIADYFLDKVEKYSKKISALNTRNYESFLFSRCEGLISVLSDYSKTFPQYSFNVSKDLLEPFDAKRIQNLLNNLNSLQPSDKDRIVTEFRLGNKAVIDLSNVSRKQLIEMEEILKNKQN